jgi:RimJ/RimL family protein N-acetyltransferase
VNSVTAISLRAATAADAKMIFGWRNDPVIVRMGSSQRPVTWAEHEEWLRQSISGDKRHIFIIERDGVAIGQVRLDLSGKSDCVISVYLAPEFSGRGWGVEAIRQACEFAFQSCSRTSVLACIRTENDRGKSAFRKAGFQQIDGCCGPGHESFQLVRSHL